MWCMSRSTKKETPGRGARRNSLDKDQRMAKGYDQPLYILPFDHRHSYGSEVFGYHEPMTPA